MSLMHKQIRLVCLLILVLFLFGSIGVAYGRYRSTIRDTVAFQAQQSDPARAITIRSANGWHTGGDGATITFLLASGTAGQQATLRLTVTEGFSTEGATVTLMVDDTVYAGVPHAITKGDPLYDKIGYGTEYRFYQADNECRWMVSAEQKYTLRVDGRADTSLLRLTATEA